MGFPCSDPCTFCSCDEGTHLFPKWMRINAHEHTACPVGHLTWSRHSGSKSFLFSNVYSKLHPSLKYFVFLLFLFIPMRCSYPAYPLHPPPTRNNPDRCRDSSALLVWCSPTGIPTIFQEQDTCPSERAQLPERSPTPARVETQPAVMDFWESTQVFICGIPFTPLKCCCCCLQKLCRWISDSTFFFSSLKGVVFLH